MKELRSNIRAILGAFVVLFVLLSVYIGYTLFINGPRWFSSPYNPVLSQQKQQVISGSITDRSYIVLAGTNESGIWDM